MYSVKQAYQVLKKKHPDLTVTKAALYDRNYYMFIAVKNPNEKPNREIDPFYAVDKRDGTLYNFTPTSDLGKFFAAFRDHEISLKEMR